MAEQNSPVAEAASLAQEVAAPAADQFAYDPEFDGIIGEDDAPDAKPVEADTPKADKADKADKSEAKPEAKPVAEAKPVEAAKPAKHDPYIERMAKRFGASQEWIDAQVPEFLEAEVHRAIARGSNPPATEKVEPKPAEIEYEFKGEKRKITEEDFPELFPAFQAQHQQIAELRKYIEDERKARDESQRESAWEAVDDQFAEQADLFGKGRTSELDKSTNEYKRRSLVVREADIRPGMTPKQIRARLAKAAEIFGAVPAVAKPAAESAKAPAKELPERDAETGQFVAAPAHPVKALEEEQRWAANGQSRPTNRTAPELPPGEERGKKNLSKLLNRVYGKDTQE